MHRTTKKLFQLVGVVAGIGAAAWAMRARMLPSPEIHNEPPPPFRKPPADTTDSDLTEIKGIGPATAKKLGDAGITTATQLAEADAEALAEAVGSSVATVERWVAEAASVR